MSQANIQNIRQLLVAFSTLEPKRWSEMQAHSELSHSRLLTSRSLAASLLSFQIDSLPASEWNTLYSELDECWQILEMFKDGVGGSRARNWNPVEIVNIGVETRLEGLCRCLSANIVLLQALFPVSKTEIEGVREYSKKLQDDSVSGAKQLERQRNQFDELRAEFHVFSSHAKELFSKATAVQYADHWESKADVLLANAKTMFSIALVCLIIAVVCGVIMAFVSLPEFNDETLPRIIEFAALRVLVIGGLLVACGWFFRLARNYLHLSESFRYRSMTLKTLEVMVASCKDDKIRDTILNACATLIYSEPNSGINGGDPDSATLKGVVDKLLPMAADK